MYERNAQGWFKHIDFILWDVIVLQVAYVLGYMIRHGWGRWPYLIPTYRNLALILVVVDLLVAGLFNIVMGGRLGSYKYYDMDQVIASALECVAGMK